jgi:hypothetical protein
MYVYAVRAMQMSYHYPYSNPSFPQDPMSPTTPGAGSNDSTPVNNPWDYDVATSTPNPAQQPQDPTSSTILSTLHPAEFSPQELFSTSAASPAVSSPTVIQLEERVPVIPSQYHRSRIRTTSGESRPRTHVQKDASSADAEQPVGASPGTAPSSGPVRASPTNVRSERSRAHPYRRPHSAGADGVVARSNVGTGRTARSVSDQPRTSPFAADRSSGLTRMRYAESYPLSLFPLLLLAHMGSDSCAGPAVHLLRLAPHLAGHCPHQRCIRFVLIFISTSIPTL